MVDPKLLAIAAAFALLAPSLAKAGPPSSAAAEFTAAFSDLDRLARETRVKGDLPRASDPKARAVLDRLWNREKVLGAGPYAAGDTPLLLDVLTKSNQTMKVYLLFTSDPATVPDTARNSLVYQDEITLAQGFLIENCAALIQSLTAFVSGLKPAEMTEVRKQGLRQARLGVVQLTSGAVLMFRSPEYSAANQELLSRALERAGPEIAAGTPAGDRRAIASATESALSAAAPSAQPRLKAFIAAMADDAPCNALCKIE